jgi:phage shock protein E
MSYIPIFIFVIVLLSISTLFVHAKNYSVNSPLLISPQEARDLLHNNHFDAVLDVRTGAERKLLGFYPGSLHIPSASIPSRITEYIPVKVRRILIYCNTGQRARMAAETLYAMGYHNVRYISGSYADLLDR